MYLSRMSYSAFYRSARCALLGFGILGFFTSVQVACTFSDDPPSAQKKPNPVTDSGPLDEHEGGASSSSGYYGQGYGYGYDPSGCYGYGYGYTPTYDGAGECD